LGIDLADRPAASATCPCARALSQAVLAEGQLPGLERRDIRSNYAPSSLESLESLESLRSLPLSDLTESPWRSKPLVSLPALVPLPVLVPLVPLPVPVRVERAVSLLELPPERTAPADTLSLIVLPTVAWLPAEVVPGLVEVEAAVPHLSPAVR